MAATLTTETHELTSEYAEAVDRLATLHVQIADLTAEAEAIKQRLRKLGEGRYAVDGVPAVSITETRRFSPQWVNEHFPPELISLCSEWIVTSRRARQVLPQSLYREAQRIAGKAAVRLES